MSTPTTNEAVRLPVATIGSHAARAIARRGAGRVCAVFERSIHIECADGILCIGGPTIGNGPHNAVIGEPLSPMWPARVERGEPVEVSSRDIRLRHWLLDYQTAADWRPESWPQPACKPVMCDALERVRSIAWDRAPREGLSRLVVCGASADDSVQQNALARIAAPRLIALGEWLGNISIADRRSDRGTRSDTPDIERMSDLAGSIRPTSKCSDPALACEENPAFPVEAVGLLGLGPGLTPSGDDLLCGALIGLHAIGEVGLAEVMARSVLLAAPAATTPLSFAFLSAAAAGEGSEALHEFIVAVIAARTDRLDETIDHLGRIGHTSGWDGLAGAFLALTAWVSAHPPRKSP